MPTNPVAVAFMTHGKWVALCPRPGCMNAESFGRCDDGTVGGLEGDRFTCRTEGWRPDGQRVMYGGCGYTCGVDWPANIRDLERALLSRPVPTTRNWTPGESLQDLVTENMRNGLAPVLAVEGMLEGAPSGTALEIVDGEVVAGRLHFTESPKELEA